jgi:hypothetical protein
MGWCEHQPFHPAGMRERHNNGHLHVNTSGPKHDSDIGIVRGAPIGSSALERFGDWMLTIEVYCLSRGWHRCYC